MKRVLVLGGTTWDSIIYLNELPQPKSQTVFSAEPLNETTGSTGAGKALNLTRLGIDTTLHSVIGDDEYGSKIINQLQVGNIKFYYDIDPLGTERHVNLMDSNGNRISIFVTNSSAQPALDLVVLESLIQEADIIVLNIISYTKQLIELIKKHRKPIWTDLHDYDGKNPYHAPYIEAADYIFLSSDNINNYESYMYKWIDEGKELVVCTHGKKGATLLTKHGEYMHVPIASDFELKDANGAGDSFFAGFLYAYLKNQSFNNCMKYATLTAGFCINSYQLVHEDLNAEILEERFNHYS